MSVTGLRAELQPPGEPAVAEAEEMERWSCDFTSGMAAGRAGGPPKRTPQVRSSAACTQAANYED